MTTMRKNSAFERECDCLPWNPSHETRPLVCIVCGAPATHYLRHKTSGQEPKLTWEPTASAAERALVRDHYALARTTFSLTGPASPLDVCTHVTCAVHKDQDDDHVAIPLSVAYPLVFGDAVANQGETT